MEENNYREQDEEQTSSSRQPVLDTLIQSRELQMLKSVVPYMPGAQQRMLSVVIKLVELQKTIQLFGGESRLQASELHICENESPTERTCHMLAAIREYCTPAEQENIDSFLNFFDVYNSYESLFSENTLPEI